MPIYDQLPCPVLVTGRAGQIQEINQCLLTLVGGNRDAWLGKSMELMFSVASRIFLQTHVWPMVLQENQVTEIRLQVLNALGQQIPVFVNCQMNSLAEMEQFTWVLYVTLERSRYEQALLESQQRAEKISLELAKREKFLRTVDDAMPSMIGYWDNHLRCQFANQPYLQWFGKTPDEMLGLSLATVLGEKLYELNMPYIQGVLAGQAQEFEREILRPDGKVGQVLANYLPDKDAQGKVNGFYALVTNISGLREADAAIRLSASVFEATMEGIMVTDVRGQIVSTNPAFTLLTGYSAQEALGQNARILKSGRHDAAFFAAMFHELHTSKLWKGEVWCKRKDGTIFLEQLSISAICNELGEINRYVGVCSDITEKWDKEQMVRHMALYDGLTGLPNRALLMERITQLIAISSRDEWHFALMFLDLDGFKLVNDTCGHEMGDIVLKAVSTRLLNLVRTSDSVARLGGDEFVILLNNSESRDSIAQIAIRIIEEINLPIQFDGKTVQVGCSIGIALFQHQWAGSPMQTMQSMSVDSLLKTADNAMYAAKAAGKNTYRFAE